MDLLKSAALPICILILIHRRYFLISDKNKGKSGRNVILQKLSRAKYSPIYHKM